MLPVSGSLHTLFILITLATFIWVIMGMVQSKSAQTAKAANVFSLLLLMWCIFQSTLALNKWYIDRVSTPPHLTFALAVPLLFFGLTMMMPYTRKIWDGIGLFHLTAVHIVRIPVEIALWMLFTFKQIPQSMTFEGHNFDIIMGITAIVFSILVYRQRYNRWVLLTWNIVGIVFLSIIVITAIGAAPTSIQWRDFHQPNYAVIHFPFIWLPSFIVPAVLFAHVLSIRKLWRADAI
jgi:hypothetical protein